MFNIGGGEILLICVLALVVVGPEQLPILMRKLGQYAGQAKQMSEALRSEFMAGTEPFQDSIKEFQKGMNDFSSTVTQNADVRTWGTGTADDPIVPRGFADQEAGGPNDEESGEADAATGTAEGSVSPAGVTAAVSAADLAEPITPPARAKKLELTPPVNPWAPLPGSGADKNGTDSNGTDSNGTDSNGTDKNSGEAAAPPGNGSDGSASAQEQSGTAEQAEKAARQLANRGRERTVIPPIAPFSSFPPRDGASVSDEAEGENA